MSPIENFLSSRWNFSSGFLKVYHSFGIFFLRVTDASIYILGVRGTEYYWNHWGDGCLIKYWSNKEGVIFRTLIRADEWTRSLKSANWYRSVKVDTMKESFVTINAFLSYLLRIFQQVILLCLCSHFCKSQRRLELKLHVEIYTYFSFSIFAVRVRCWNIYRIYTKYQNKVDMVMSGITLMRIPKAFYVFHDANWMYLCTF